MICYQITAVVFPLCRAVFVAKMVVFTTVVVTTVTGGVLRMMVRQVRISITSNAEAVAFTGTTALRRAVFPFGCCGIKLTISLFDYFFRIFSYPFAGREILKPKKMSEP